MMDWNAAEHVSLKPLPWEALENLDDRERDLQSIGDNIAYWLRYTIEHRSAEHLDTEPDTAVMLPSGDNRPPAWPNVGQLKRWLLVLRGDLASVDTDPEGRDTK
jgi:hypothetical protein